MKPSYYKELDGIRGVAALMVMYFHFWIGVDGSTYPVLGYAVKTSVFGQTGVTLFFVLSGFLITRILLSTKSSHNYFSAFYIRRSLRIFPLYYLALVIYLSVAPLLEPNQMAPTEGSWSFWLYLQNIFMTFKLPINGPLHFWSLAVEEHFYLFWPLLVYFLSTKHLLKTCYGLVVLSIIFRIALLQQGYEVFYFTFTTMDALAIGAILALKEQDILTHKNFGSRSFAAVGTITFALILLWYLSGGQGLFFIQAFKGTIIALLYALVLAMIINPIWKRSQIGNLLLARPLLYTGRISYGLYVYHVLCFSAYKKYLSSSYVLLDFFGCIFVSFVVAAVSYAFFEKKFILLKDRVAFVGGLQVK